MKAIKIFFELPNAIREIKTRNKVVSEEKNLFYIIETYNKVSLDKISSFFLRKNVIGLLGSKKDQFFYFEDMRSLKK